MMSKPNIWIAAMMFFLVPGLMALGGKPETPDEDVSRSRSVKIERQDKAKDKASEKAVSGAGEAETEKPVSLLPEAVEAGDGSDGGDAATDTDGAGAQVDEKELGDLMIDEQEEMFRSEERLYTRKGRVDPFEPFMRGSSRQESGEEEDGAELQRRRPQTPLEKIALSQLKLTAILRLASDNDAIAMVEDPSGKGYVVKKGTWIGDQGGRVAEIRSDRIIVQEQYKDVFGKIAEREIEKKLQQ
ncbi:MAG: pilus assembly protein PilP [Desulfosalsimonas sp.]|uniref:pilus assembly protein PilP n=1 Tax=Desulfosalsimonas sp. TaxID=3073848 RepID=UPI00397051D3